MSDEITLIVVSVEGTTEALVEEIRSRGLTVIESAFFEIEEHLAESTVDLIVLNGARGAMELATVLEDQEGPHPPQMAVVAPRKDLAGLTGLDRDRVAALLATETSVRAVAMRLESLARRHGRLRGVTGVRPVVAFAPRPSGTSGTMKAVTEESPNPPRVDTTPSDSVAEILQKPTVPVAAPDTGPQRKLTPAGIPRPSLIETQEEFTSADPSALESQSADAEELGDSILESVPDELGGSVLESLPDELGDSILESVPASRPEQVSHYDLDIQARHPGSLDSPKVPGGLDPLEALDQLEMPREGTEGAESGDESAPTGSADVDSKQVETSPGLGPEVIDDVLAASLAGEEASKPSSGTSADEGAEALIDVETPAAREVDESAPATSPTVPSSDGDSEVAGADVSQEAPAPERRGGRGYAWLLAALVAGLGAFAYFGDVAMLKQLRGPAPGPDNAPSQPQPAGTPKGAEETPSTEAADAQTPTEDEKSGAPPDGSQKGAEGETAARRAAGDLDNPYRNEEKPSPSCDTLVTEPEKPVGDAIAASSQAWAVARNAVVQGDLKTAQLEMCRAIALNPESAALEGLALLYLTMGSPSQALPYIERAQKLRPDDHEVVMLKGDILSQLGQSEEALAIWLDASKLTAEDENRRRQLSKSYATEGRKLARRKDYPRAERYLRRAALLDPESVVALAALAEVFHETNRSDQALYFAKKSVEVSDLYPEAHVVLGDLALERGDRELAKKSYERALQIHPKHWAATTKLRDLESEKK